MVYNNVYYILYTYGIPIEYPIQNEDVQHQAGDLHFKRTPWVVILNILNIDYMGNGPT
jgi:hypothetical protein